jgi:hypothetical protein
MKKLYALLCLIGLIVPYYFFVPYVLNNGLSIPDILQQLFLNPVSSFFGTDVIVSSLVLWVYIYHETRSRRIPLWWLSIISNLIVGLSLAFPLFLLLRESAQRKNNLAMEIKT